jgi:hypothetical protein
MRTTTLRRWHVGLIALIAFTSKGQTVLLFENHFDAPNQTPVANCGPDLDATFVNTLWGGTGTGTGGGGLWSQLNTVETILINGADNVYTDSLGIGGDHCLSMLSTFQDDRAALTLNCEGLPFVNLYMDISAIDLVACGGPFGMAQPSFHVSVFDSPGGVFDMFAPGILLDEDTLYGVVPGSDPYTFTWASVATGLHVANSTDGNVTVMLDLLTSGYAAFDNIVINASVSAEGIQDLGSWGNDMNVWPNPAEDHLSLSSIPINARWSIIDGRGTTVAVGSRITTAGFDLTRFAPGIYTLRCVLPDRSRAFQFIKR